MRPAFLYASLTGDMYAAMTWYPSDCNVSLASSSIRRCIKVGGLKLPVATRTTFILLFSSVEFRPRDTFSIGN
ncbi:hypothetical protein OIU79_018655 [Salix purpurea]|uniref:Uncharacterized protein n=1 Tax=Salix purpurea TaxID=77065 RepID=A0A9Q1ALA4_SALPP|nr:hypothetical protein OIU79_018655 [Salix purpurea]